MRYGNIRRQEGVMESCASRASQQTVLRVLVPALNRFLLNLSVKVMS